MGLAGFDKRMVTRLYTVWRRLTKELGKASLESIREPVLGGFVVDWEAIQKADRVSWKSKQVFWSCWMSCKYKEGKREDVEEGEHWE